MAKLRLADMLDNNYYFISKIVNERIETALKEAEMTRLAKLAAQDQPSFWSSGCKLLLIVCNALSSWRIVLKGWGLEHEMGEIGERERQETAGDL
jgi:hypothetical protein